MNYKLYKGDCLELLPQIPTGSVDLVVTDPPYQIDVDGGGRSKLSARMKKMKADLINDNLVSGFDAAILGELVRVMKNINIYLWCNAKQIPMYLKYFVDGLGCSFEILVWIKSNAAPLFNHKYLNDKEYCLYFRKDGYCNPESYELAQTYFLQPLNAKDKQLWEHPTIKPLNIIQRLVMNSSKEGETVLDCFMGSGTTGAACVRTGRNFIGMEINEKYYEIAQFRLKDENQPTLFENYIEQNVL